MPTNNNDLETTYTVGEKINVAIKDDVRVSQSSAAEYAIHQFKDFVGAAAPIAFEWEGQTNTACTWSTVYLQIYNHDSGAWETLDSDSTSLADTDFALTGSIADPTNYKDGSNIVSCRVYQLAV